MLRVADWKSRRQVLRVRDFVVHPDYSGSWAGPDLAVVRLQKGAQLGPAVQPVCLPFLLRKANFAGRPVVTLGESHPTLEIKGGGYVLPRQSRQHRLKFR